MDCREYSKTGFTFLKIINSLLVLLLLILYLRAGKLELVNFDLASVVDAKSYLIVFSLSNDTEIAKFITHDGKLDVAIPKDIISFICIENHLPIFFNSKAAQVIYLPRSPPEMIC